MSGASPPLRWLWFGEGLTSATTEDSGRNSDATIHAPDVCRSRLDLRNTKSSSRQAAAIVQKQRCETSSPPQRLRQIPGCCCKRAAPQNATAGPACGRPDRATPGRLSSRLRYSLDVPDKYATRSSTPTTRPLVNVSRPSFSASCGRSGRPRRHAGGRRPASAARRACRRLVILEVRRVLELVLGPADFELDHG